MASPRKTIVAEIIQGIGDHITARGGESLSFGPVQQEDGITVIPVTQVGYGFGFGFGQGPKAGDTDDAAPNQGGGGGGGGFSRPIGYIQISGGQAEFVPVRDINLIVVIAAIATTLITIVALRSRRRPGRR